MRNCSQMYENRLTNFGRHCWTSRYTSPSSTCWRREREICAVAYCYLFSAYAKLTLYIVKFTHDVVLRITAPFVFPSDISCLIMTLYLVQCFSSVFGMWRNFEMLTSMCPRCIFFSFLRATSKSYCSKFQGCYPPLVSYIKTSHEKKFSNFTPYEG